MRRESSDSAPDARIAVVVQFPKTGNGILDSCIPKEKETEMSKTTDQPKELPRKRKARTLVTAGCLAVLTTSAVTLLAPSESKANSCDPPCEWEKSGGTWVCGCDC